jgi:hypothetical protein
MFFKFLLVVLRILKGFLAFSCAFFWNDYFDCYAMPILPPLFKRFCPYRKVIGISKELL